MTSHRHRHFVVTYLFTYLLVRRFALASCFQNVPARHSGSYESQPSSPGRAADFRVFFLAAKHISLWSPCLVHGLIINEMLKVFRCRYVFQEQN